MMIEYCVAGDFHELEEKHFCGENIRTLLASGTKDATSPNFAEKTFANSHQISKFVSFLPHKFPTKQYCTVVEALSNRISCRYTCSNTQNLHKQVNVVFVCVLYR